MVGDNWVTGKEGTGASSPVDDSAADVSSDDDVSAVGGSVLDASSTDIDSATGTSGVGNNSMSASDVAVKASSTIGASDVGVTAICTPYR